MATLNRIRFTAGCVGCVLVAALTILFAPPAMAGESIVAPQREVQAVFLLNLTRFIRWPEQAFSAEDAPLYIGVLPGDPVGEVLAEAAKGETAGRHPIIIRSLTGVDQLEGCHVVYFGGAESAEVLKFMNALRGKSVLMVGDAEGFLRLGGHVQLYSRAGQVRLRLDVRTLRRADLSASSQLLRVSEVIGN